MSLSIWLIAAAPAAPSEPRGLAPAARAELVVARKQCERLGLQFERLVHAPLLGSLASAHLLSRLVDGETLCEPRLVVGPLEALLPELEPFARVAVVADAAQLARLAALLVCGSESHAARFELRVGAPICCVGAAHPGGMRVTGVRPASDSGASR